MSLGRRRRTLERMPGYVVEPSFHHSCDIGADDEERCRQIFAGNRDDVAWLRSYVSEDGRKSSWPDQAHG
jgi:hypothetical protein